MANLRGAVIPVTPFQQNCAILWDDATKLALVVDPGGDVDRILTAIDQAGRESARSVEASDTVPGP